MNSNKHYFPARAAAVAVGLGLLVALAGCTGDVDPPMAGTEAAPAQSAFVLEGDYDYYPGYQVYYNRDSHLYAFLTNGAWVYQAEPAGVTIPVLRASPSVRMAFRDSPANHNAEMKQKYPRNWKPPGA